MQVNGTQLTAACFDGTVTAWSYPKGKILFKMKGHKESVFEIKWNPFKQDVFATRQRVRNAVDSLFRRLSAFSVSFYLEGEGISCK